MSDSQHSDSSSSSLLAKLLEVDTELAYKEAQLLVQLQDVQEKRRSLKTVLGLFTATDTATTEPAVALAQSLPPSTEQSTARAANNKPEPELDVAPATVRNAIAAADNQKQPVKKTEARSSKRRKALPAPKTNTAKNTSSWQQYLQQEYSFVGLPEAVSTVLQQQQEQALETSAIVDALFVAEMPPPVRRKARDRVAHILSEGVRKNKWYRTSSGSYSMSPEATENNLASL